MGEAEEGVVLEFDIPLGAAPAFGGFPPVAGEGEGSVGVEDGAAVGAVEEDERVMVAAPWFGGDVDRDGRAVAGERKGGLGRDW